VNYYYPTNTLVTAPEIIFFWVARMIMAGFEFKKEKPFSEVYFTGIVRDKLGRKMSKSLGNSPDLLELIDTYGADACRFGIMISSPAGNDLLWDEGSNEQGRNFINKIWNALRLVKLWQGNTAPSTGPRETSFAIHWFENRLRQAKEELDQQFRDFRLSEALKTVYSLIWDDFCSWYLEWVKPGYQQPVDQAVVQHTNRFFEELMQLLHPFMPFITEEVYHLLAERKPGEDLTILPYRPTAAPEAQVLQQGLLLKNIITGLRDLRNKQQLKPKDPIELFVNTSAAAAYEPIREILCKQVNAKSLTITEEQLNGALTTVIEKDRFFIVTENQVDSGSQREALLKELEYHKGFLISVEKKLGNERFVQNAKPEVVAMEQKKKEDAEAKIRMIEESLRSMK
jgi:valyl-tRNA synthetase